MNELAAAGAALVGGTVRRAEALGGGCLSQLVRVVLGDGREVVVKRSPTPDIEADMLRAIAATGAPAPAVLGENDDILVMEALPHAAGLNSGWGNLGTALATLHRARGQTYGWAEDYAFGAVAIENGWMDDWTAFWATRRLTVNQPHIPSDLARRIETLAADLPNRLPSRPAPALLHGDLWGGNIVVSRGVVYGLVDPACYYGHCEVDLAMLTLFDNPRPAFWDAYGPLEPGHEERRVIYQLWPALVHLRLFGRGYLGMVEGLLTSIRA